MLLKFRLKMLWRDRGYLLAMLCVAPLVALLMGGIQSFNTAGEIPVVMVDQDHTDLSRLVVSRFAEQPGIRVAQVTEAQARDLVANYQVEVAFIIKKGFKEGLLREEIDGGITLLKSPVALSYGVIQEMLASQVQRLWADAAAANWVADEYGQDLWQEAWDEADGLWQPKPW